MTRSGADPRRLYDSAVSASLTATVRRLARRRYFVSGLAAGGLLATFAAMWALDDAGRLGAIALAPWVGLLGFELGFLGGLGAASGTLGLWLLAVWLTNLQESGFQVGVRAGALLLLGAGGGIVGRRLRSSEAAQRSLATLQSALIDATVDGICLTDAEGNILIANKPLRTFSAELGIPAAGTVPDRLLALADRIAEPERYRRRMLELASATGEATSDEFEVAGTGRVFRGYTAPVLDERGRFTGRLWTLREVTADRELDRMRDAFVASVSHELRTPLTSIAGFLEMMEDEEQALGASGRTYLTVIRRSVERLHSLVEDLLLVAQIEAHRVELELEPLDLAELAARCAEAARPAADDKHVSLEVVGEGAPSVLGDRQRLAQVLDNLISNAIKFTDEGGSVTVSVAGNNTGARLVVADTGIGVPADEQDKVFSRFFRSRTATQRSIPGTGLGLGICRALVEQHGGEIAFASREGEGTSVTVTLPAAHA